MSMKEIRLIRFKRQFLNHGLKAHWHIETPDGEELEVLCGAFKFRDKLHTYEILTFTPETAQNRRTKMTLCPRCLKHIPYGVMAKAYLKDLIDTQPWIY